MNYTERLMEEYEKFKSDEDICTDWCVPKVEKFFLSHHTDFISNLVKDLEKMKGKRHPNELFFQECGSCGAQANMPFVT